MACMEKIWRFLSGLVALLALICCWYAALSPDWVSQSGDNGISSYSAGYGIWLNYTIHNGESWFDGGNSFYDPIRSTGSMTYNSQCLNYVVKDCTNSNGDLAEQLCLILNRLCGPAMYGLKICIAIACGFSLAIFFYTFNSLLSSHKVLSDILLPSLAAITAGLLVAILLVWYIYILAPLVNTVVLNNQYSRCIENPTNRKCWSFGYSFYGACIGSTLYVIFIGLAFRIRIGKMKTFRKRLMQWGIDHPKNKIKYETGV